MRVVLAAIGSRGDVAPFTSLAARFAAAGHEVDLVTHAGFDDLIPPGVRVTEVASDPDTLLAGPAATALRRGNVRALNQTREVFADFVHSAQSGARAALPGADVLIASTFAIAAVDEAMAAGVPVVRAHMWPEYSTLTGPMPLLPYGWLAPPPLRWLARRGLRWAEPYLGGVTGRWRRGRLHLKARHPVGLTTATLGTLFAYSPELVPETPPDGAVTGWWLDASEESPLSGGVEAALDEGDDWIYAGFGSMAQPDADALVATIGDACDRLGVRALVQLGDLRGRPHPRVLCIGEEPHVPLFRRVRAIIHHGGAGTTSSVIRAGTPSVPVPHFADQFYWGDRLHKLGVAARPLPRALLRAGSLSRSLERAWTPANRRRAGDLAGRVADEDGCGCAVAQVERWLDGRG